MTTPYETVQNMIDKKIAECNKLISNLDKTKEREGVIRLLIKKRYFDDIVNRCALLQIESKGITDDELRELFGDDMYEAGVKMYEDMKKLWQKSLTENMS